MLKWKDPKVAVSFLASLQTKLKQAPSKKKTCNHGCCQSGGAMEQIEEFCAQDGGIPRCSAGAGIRKGMEAILGSPLKKDTPSQAKQISALDQAAWNLPRKQRTTQPTAYGGRAIDLSLPARKSQAWMNARVPSVEQSKRDPMVLSKRNKALSSMIVGRATDAIRSLRVAPLKTGKFPSETGQIPV